jgi:hypothetical protein
MKKDPLKRKSKNVFTPEKNVFSSGHKKGLQLRVSSMPKTIHLDGGI